MKKKLLLIIVFLILINIITLFFVKKNSKNLIDKTIFIPRQSLSVGEIVNIANKIEDFENNEIILEGKKIFIFGNKNCGSCFYITFPLIEWVKTFKDIQFLYIETSNQVPLLYSECKDERNFHLILDKDNYFYRLFGEPNFPTIFFINEENRIVWKRTGFLILHYKEYTKRIEEFIQGKEIFDDYQVNIKIGMFFPEIKYRYHNKLINLPNDFLGKPSLIFFINSSCEICKNVLEYIPSSISKNCNINKIIILSGISNEVMSENLEFAKKFSLKDVELQVRQSEFYNYINLSYLQRITKDFQCSLIIEDNFFEISKRIGLMGGPFLCILDSKGKIIFINSIGFPNIKDYKKFYKECEKIINRGGEK